MHLAAALISSFDLDAAELPAKIDPNAFMHRVVAEHVEFLATLEYPDVASASDLAKIIETHRDRVAFIGAAPSGHLCIILNNPESERLHPGDPDLQWRSVADRSYYFGQPELLIRYSPRFGESYTAAEYLIGTGKDIRDVELNVVSRVVLGHNIELKIRQEKQDSFSSVRISSSAEFVDFTPRTIDGFLQSWARCITPE